MSVIRYDDISWLETKLNVVRQWLNQNVGTDSLKTIIIHSMNLDLPQWVTMVRETCPVPQDVLVGQITIYSGEGWMLFAVAERKLGATYAYVMYVHLQDELLALQCKLATL